MSFKHLIPQKLHRKIEKALAVEKNCLKEQVQQLKSMRKTDAEILEIVTGAIQWMELYAPSQAVPVVLQTYISCLKHPAEKA